MPLAGLQGTKLVLLLIGNWNIMLLASIMKTSHAAEVAGEYELKVSRTWYYKGPLNMESGQTLWHIKIWWHSNWCTIYISPEMARWTAETCSKIWIYFNQSKVLTWPRYLVFRHCENTTGPYPQPARITFVFRLDPSFVFYMFTAPKAFLILANRDITILSHLAQFDLHNNIWWTVVHYGTQEDKIVSSLPYVQLVFSIMCFRKL